MKSLLHTLFFFLLITQMCFAQADFWEQANGPGGGDISWPMAINSDGDIFAALAASEGCNDGNGVFRSTDNGMTWKPFQNGITNTDLSCGILINKNGYYFTGSYGGGMFRSTDLGYSWSSLQNSPAYARAITTDINGDILVGTFWDGIYKSTDDGETWVPLNSGLGWIAELTVDNSGNIYVGQGEYTGGGIYKSVNNGQTWEYLGLSGQWIISICFTQNGYIFASDYSRGVYRSQDQGSTWTQVNSGITSLGEYAMLTADSLDRIYYGTDDGLFRSSDYGSTWIKLNSFYQSKFAFINVPGIIIEAMRGLGIMRSSDDGITWYQQGPALSEVTSVCSLSDGILLTGYEPICPYFYNNLIGLYRSTDFGDSWVDFTLLGKYIHTIKNTANQIVFAGTNDGLYKSTNYGKDWSFLGLANTDVNSILSEESDKLFAATSDGIYFSADSGLSWSFFGMLNTNVLSCGVVESNYFFAGSDGQGIYVSSDQGANWAFTGLPNLSVHSIIVAANNNILAGTNGGVYLSTNTGISWSYTGLLDDDLQTLFLQPSGFLFAGTANSGVYYSTNLGITWLQENSGLTNTNVRCFSSDNDGFLYAGTDGNGVFKSSISVPVELTSFTATSNGKEVLLNWSTATELNNFGFEIQRSIEGDEFFTIGFVNGYGTTTEQHNYTYSDKNLENGKCYYRLKQVDFNGTYEYSDVIEVEWRAFNSYLLEQNYPNPFNPTTTIGFGLQNKSNVKITILNAIGEEVAVLLNEEREAGYHQVEFNATNLPSGVYFYQMKTGSFIETKKMILIK